MQNEFCRPPVFKAIIIPLGFIFNLLSMFRINWTQESLVSVRV